MHLRWRQVVVAWLALVAGALLVALPPARAEDAKLSPSLLSDMLLRQDRGPAGAGERQGGNVNGIGSAEASAVQPAPVSQDAKSPAGGDQIKVAPELIKQVQEQLGKRAVARALQLIDAEIARQPTHAGLHHFRGFVLQLTGNEAAALAEYEKAIAIVPGFVEAWLDRIRSKILLGRASEAEADCNQVLKGDTGRARAYHLRGVARADLRRFTEARADLHQAIEEDPKLAPAWFSLALVDVEQKQLQRALTHLERVLEIDPRFAEAYARRGEIRLSMRDAAAAEADFKKALSISRGSWVARRGLQSMQAVKVLEQLGHVKKGA